MSKHPIWVFRVGAVKCEKPAQKTRVNCLVMGWTKRYTQGEIQAKVNSKNRLIEGYINYKSHSNLWEVSSWKISENAERRHAIARAFPEDAGKLYARRTTAGWILSSVTGRYQWRRVARKILVSGEWKENLPKYLVGYHKRGQVLIRTRPAEGSFSGS